MKKVSFTNTKGDRLVGIISNKVRSKDKPIIILAHGFTSSKDSGTYTTLAEELEKQDIASFRFDFFAHGESEGNFADITVSEAVDDILQAIKYLKIQGYKHIGLMGSSFGGLSSIMAASKTNDLFILALKSPVSNYLQKEIETKTEKELDEWKEKGYRYYVDNKGKKYKLNYTFFEDFENNNGWEIAHKIKVPTLIVHGNKDKAVPYQHSVRVSKLFPNCILHTVKNANHFYEKQEQFREMTDTLTNFIVKHSKKFEKQI